MDSDDETRRVLARIGIVRHRCDLDLLIFFVQHPNTLLMTEQLAAFVGYELPRISASLDTLIESRLLTQTQNPTHAARWYEFTPGESTGDWLPSLVRLASTRDGRLALREALRSNRASEASDRSDVTNQSVAPKTAAQISRIDGRRNEEKRHA